MDWNANDIDKILEVLEENQVKVTFFMVGQWIEKYPEAVKKINNAGHEIGSHSYSHPHVNNLSYEDNLKELDKANTVLESLIGKKTNIYRTPYGEYNNTVIKAANDAGYTTIQWSLDTLDYEGLTGEEMWNRLENKLKNGDIILSHNGTKHTAESLDMLIKRIKQKGFEVVKVTDILKKNESYINSQGIQVEK